MSNTQGTVEFQNAPLDMVRIVGGLFRMGSSGFYQEEGPVREVTVDGFRIAQKSGRRERAGLFEAATAVWEAFYGNRSCRRIPADCRDLLALWKDADPKIPVVNEARAEYGRLP